MDLEVAAGGAAGGRAAPAVAYEDRIVGDVVGVLVRVPGGDEVLDEREEPDPRRDPAAADGKRPSGKERRGRRVGRPVGVPRYRLDLFGDPPARDLDCGEETCGQIVGERQAKENIRIRDEGAGGTERGRGWRRRRARDDGTDAECYQAECGDAPARGPRSTAERGVPGGIGQRRPRGAGDGAVAGGGAGTGAQAEGSRSIESARLVAQSLDGQLRGVTHPISLDVGSVGVGGGEDAADDQGGFEAEDVALVSVAQEWKTSEQARGAGARLDRGAREAEALLGVVAHPGEAQTVPYVL